MDLLLGVDGGGTKTDIALKDSLGRVYLAYAAGSNHEAIGFERVRVLLKDGIEKLLEQMSDFGWEAKAKTFVEIGMQKMQDARDLVEQLERVSDGDQWPLTTIYELLYHL